MDCYEATLFRPFFTIGIKPLLLAGAYSEASTVMVVGKA
jgi:hypothetical protein